MYAPKRYWDLKTVTYWVDHKGVAERIRGLWVHNPDQNVKRWLFQRELRDQFNRKKSEEVSLSPSIPCGTDYDVLGELHKYADAAFAEVSDQVCPWVLNRMSEMMRCDGCFNLVEAWGDALEDAP